VSASRHNASWTVPRLAAHITGAVATAAMAGWIFDLPALTRFFTHLTSMKANAALSFILLAEALHLAVTRRHTSIQALLASGAVLLGCLTLFEYITGQQLGIDQLVFHDPVASAHPGRMSPITAVNFMLLGIALLPFGRRGAEVVKEILSLAAVTTSMFAVVGYLYGIPALYGAISSGWIPIAPHTAGSFMLLALGFLFVHREGGLVRIFYGQSIAAMVARFLVPVAVIVPIFLGAVFMHERMSNGHLPLAMAFSVISNVVLLVALIWYFCFMIEHTEEEREILRRQAETDRLTGIYNRRYFETSLEHEVERTRRYQTPLSLIMFDIDWFKKLNDRYGHMAGDRALMRVARACERNLRSADIFCRYGGEEFVIIAPETTGGAALQLARRIREAIAATRLDGLNDPVTVSLGVAEWDQTFATKEDLVAAADRALYRAKRSGRNRECLHGTQQEGELASTTD
jgi:diguanylate cyclase (GGDEF)-like protein